MTNTQKRRIAKLEKENEQLKARVAGYQEQFGPMKAELAGLSQIITKQRADIARMQRNEKTIIAEMVKGEEEKRLPPTCPVCGETELLHLHSRETITATTAPEPELEVDEGPERGMVDLSGVIMPDAPGNPRQG